MDSTSTGKWPLIDPKRGIPRAAMICEILRTNDSKIHWVELEINEQDRSAGWKAVLFALGVKPVVDVARELLEHASASRGIWGDPALLAKDIGLASARCLDHRRAADGRINLIRLHTAIGGDKFARK